MKELRTAIEALPVHTISGYEWECSGDCHYHWANTHWDTSVRQNVLDDEPRICETCGGASTEDSEVDRDGRICDHGRLVDLDQVLELLNG